MLISEEFPPLTQNVMMFKPISIFSTVITDPLLLRRIYDGSISRFAAHRVNEEIIKGYFDNADIAIDALGLLQLTNNRAVLDIIDKLIQEKDACVEEAIRTNDASALMARIMRDTKGKCSPWIVEDYLKLLKNVKTE